LVLRGGSGAVFGGLAGTVNGTVAGVGVTKRIDALLTWVFPLPVRVKDLLPTAGVQIGGITGGILGAVNGALKLAWMAFYWPWLALYPGGPDRPAAAAGGPGGHPPFVRGRCPGGRGLAAGVR